MKGKPSLLVIGWELLRVGAFSFGGMGATLALLQQRVVERRQWLVSSDISEALAFTRALPGSTGIQIAAWLGWKLRRWPGALVAATAFIAPAAIMMTLAAAGSLMLPSAPWVRGALIGIQIAVVGLLLSTFLRLSRSEAKRPIFLAVLAAGSILGFFVHAVVVVLGAGLLGVAMARRDA
jgi:chromate transporter